MENLIRQIREIFHDDHINTEDIRRVLENYKSNPADWKKYANFDPHKYEITALMDKFALFLDIPEI